MEDQLLDMLMQKDEITWQSIIYDLVKTDKMDPWNVDISVLTKRYVQIIRKMAEHDFRVSGKIVLAAAILLKIKSTKLLNEGINNLDTLINGIEEEEELFFEEYFHEFSDEVYDKPDPYSNIPLIVPKTPMPRKRKVSVFDLVKALEKALEVENRRKLKIPKDAPEVSPPKKTVDITIIIKELYSKIKDIFRSRQMLTFDDLIPSKSREDQIYTFIPLLHLTNQRKIDLNQKQPFGTINIQLLKP